MTATENKPREPRPAKKSVVRNTSPAGADGVPVLVWQGCYDGHWRGILAKAAWKHPAKFAPRLLERIYAHGFEQGWWKKGNLIGDCFGGVACGGVIAGYCGLNWIGVELEPDFCVAGNENLAKHGPAWMAIGEVTSVKLVQGDSRRFADLREGSVDAVVASPSYADNQRSDRTAQERDERRGFRQGKGCFRTSEAYGKTEGQIGGLGEGSIDAAVTSPSYEGTDLAQKDGRSSEQRLEQVRRAVDRGDQVGPEFRRMIDKGVNPNSNLRIEGYGKSAGQIGAAKGETYWSAMAVVYQQVMVAVKSGGVVCVVLKDYVKKKQRVPLCDQTMRLLRHLGFEPVCRIRAMLVEQKSEAGLFGERITRTKQKKSFFRRLQEKKGSPRIDWEEVLVVRRPR